MTIRRRLGISATGACVALMFATVPAAAQPSPSPSPSPGVGDNAAPSGQASVAIAIAVLVLGAIVLGVLYQYLNAWRKNIYTLTRRFVESTGSFPAMTTWPR
jgi:hypothetical protein